MARRREEDMGEERIREEKMSSQSVLRLQVLHSTVLQ